MILPRISRRPFAFGAWLVRTLFWGVATMAAASTWADDASHRQLWTIPAVGGEPRLLADSPGYDCGSPDWSPDGKWIAYDNWQIGKGIPDVDVVVIRSDGTDRQVLGHGAMPSWSPDGKQLVCHMARRNKFATLTWTGA